MIKINLASTDAQPKRPGNLLLFYNVYEMNLGPFLAARPPAEFNISPATSDATPAHPDAAHPADAPKAASTSVIKPA